MPLRPLTHNQRDPVQNGNSAALRHMPKGRRTVESFFLKTTETFLLVSVVTSVCLWATGSLGLDEFLIVLGLALGTADYLNGLPFRENGEQ